MLKAFWINPEGKKFEVPFFSHIKWIVKYLGINDQIRANLSAKNNGWVAIRTTKNHLGYKEILIEFIKITDKVKKIIYNILINFEKENEKCSYVVNNKQTFNLNSILYLFYVKPDPWEGRMKPKIILIDAITKSIEVTYNAFKICYSKESVSKSWDDIQNNTIDKEKIKKFINEKLETNHTSPLRLIHFVFGIENVSRAFSAQFNRHVVGVDRNESSQRYIDFTKGIKQFVTPKTFLDCKFEEKGKVVNPIMDSWDKLQNEIINFYKLCKEYDIPNEDARFALPMGTVTRLVVSFSFEALQHFIKVRSCFCAQWEIREVSNQLLKIMKKEFPVLGRHLGKKCSKNSIGFCDESKETYNKCPMSKTRPHKKDLLELWDKK